MANQPPFTEYPRPSGPALAYSGRPPGVYFDAIGESWGIVRQDLGTWMAAALLTILMMFVALAPLGPSYLHIFQVTRGGQIDPSELGGIFLLEIAIITVANVVQQFLLAGLVSLAVRKLRGETIEIGMLFDSFRRFGKVIAASILFFIVYIVSCMACGVPALFFGPVLMLMTSVALIQNVSATTALSITFQACKAHWAGLLGILIVMGLLVGISFYICFIPVLFTLPMLAVVLGIHYRAFFESYQPQPYGTMPPSY